MTGITKVGAGVGIMAVPLLANWLISGYGWRTAYVVLGIVAGAGIVLAALLFKRDPSQIGGRPYGADEAQSTEEDSEAAHFSLRRAMRTRQLWMFSAIWFSFIFCVQVVMVHIANHVTDLGLSPAIGASVISVVGGFSIFGRLGLAGLSDKIGPKSAYMIALSLLTSSFVLLQFAGEAWAFYIFAAMYGVAHGAYFALLAPMIAGLFGLRSLGSILGVILFIGTFAGLVSPVLTGWVFDTINSYQPAFITCLVLNAISIMLLFSLKPIANSSAKTL
jgi:predicted MFS family arabinose efflux permease